MNDLSDKIRLLRTAQNINQTKLAKLVGITQPFLSDIEKGKRNPSIEVLQKLCDVLGCSADYLLNRPTDSSNSPNMREDSFPGGLSPDILRYIQERNISEEDLKTALRITAAMRESN